MLVIKSHIVYVRSCKKSYFAYYRPNPIKKPLKQSQNISWNHGRNLVGDTGDVSPPLFSLRVCTWWGFKTKYDVCHVLCEEFFML